MKWLNLSAVAITVLVSASSFTVSPALATSPVPVTIGTSWDAPGNDLQVIVDNYIGTPGAINVQTDYVGAHAADLDPWFWYGSSLPALLITEVAGNANVNELGWYRETFVKPVIDGVDDGIVFTGLETDGAVATIVFPAGTSKFGFFLDTHRVIDAVSGTQEQVFFTNRFANDLGTYGYGATHAPFDGDVQALVFDVSQWKGPNTWLVCFEDTDSGSPIQACCNGTDDDYNDVVFQVTASGATPTQSITFGALKAIYR
jgi:hypothetical protein